MNSRSYRSTNTGEDVSFALTFWERWVEVPRGRWRVHATVKRAEWPRFARALARAVRRGTTEEDSVVSELLERFERDYERPRLAGSESSSGRATRIARANCR